MDCYFCIIGTDEDAFADLYVLDASDDEDARTRARAAAAGVGAWAQVRIYEGERLVGTIERVTPARELPLAA